MRKSSPPLGRPLSGVRSRGPLVLIVDGDEVARGQLGTELAASGFMVLEAYDGATAIDKASQFGPHAIVLDLVLPGCDGLKVARRLRELEETREVSIVAISALHSENVREMVLAAGCDAFFCKPVMGATLVAEIIRLLAKRAGRAPPDMTRVVR